MLVSQYSVGSTLSDASSFILTESDDFLGSLASVPPIPGQVVCAFEAEPCAAGREPFGPRFVGREGGEQEPAQYSMWKG